MTKFICLPFISHWTYEARPGDSRPCFSGYGVLVNLDAVKKIHPLTEDNTMLDDMQVPLSIAQIMHYWAEWAMPLDQVDKTPLPYAPSWDRRYNICRLGLNGERLDA